MNKPMKVKKDLTAGRAKNEIPNIAQKAAISLPHHVIGTVSPYPTVHRVICKQNLATYTLHYNGR